MYYNGNLRAFFICQKPHKMYVFQIIATRKDSEKGMAKYRIGIDVGSTTTKLVLTENNEMTYHKYIRHFAKQRESIIGLLEEIKDRPQRFGGDVNVPFDIMIPHQSLPPSGS